MMCDGVRCPESIHMYDRQISHNRKHSCLRRDVYVLYAATLVLVLAAHVPILTVAVEERGHRGGCGSNGGQGGHSSCIGGILCWAKSSCSVVRHV
jgi:hypothetical protein